MEPGATRRINQRPGRGQGSVPSARGLEAIRESPYWRFRTDDAIHREQIELVLAENRELHTEFND